MIKQPQRRSTSSRNVLFFLLAAVVVFACPSRNNAATITPTQHQLDSSVEPGAGLQQHEPTDHQLAPYPPLFFLRGGGRRNRILDYYSSCTTVWDTTTNSYICQPDSDKKEPLRIFIPILLVVLFILCAYCKCIQLQRQQEDALAQQQQQQLVPAQHHQHQPSNYSNPANHHPNNGQARLVTAAAIIQRSSPNARAGIGFVGKDYAEITRIQHDSIFHGSDLVPGMKVVSINNISIGSARQAAEIIATAMALKDALTILAHSPGYYGSTENFVTATVVKERPDQPLGITYRKEFTHGPIRLGTISETSLLLQSLQYDATTATSTPSGSDLAPGMEVVAVNNVPAQSLAQVTEVTRTAFPIVTILARRSAAVVVAVMESGDSNASVVARPISQSYAIGDEPLAMATATATTTTMIAEEDRGSSIEL